MGFWTNRAIYALLKTKPAKKSHPLPAGMLAPVALPTLFSIKSYVRRVAWLSNTKGNDPENHFNEVAGLKSVGVISYAYPVVVTLIYTMPIFSSVARLMANPDSRAARFAIGAMASNIPGTLLGLVLIHIAFRWLLLAVHAYTISKKLSR
jgi:hypothetical protein